MSLGSFFSWIEVNRSTFDKERYEKNNFYVFVPTFSFPATSTFDFLTDGQTAIVQRLMRSLRMAA